MAKNEMKRAVWEEFLKVRNPAYAKCEEAIAAARAEYNKVLIPAEEEFNKRMAEIDAMPDE